MKNSFWQNAVTYGFIIGLLLIILSLVDWQLGFYGQKVAFSMLSYVVMIGGLVWSALAYRKQLGGYISYGQLVGFGVVTVVVYTLVSGLFTILLTQVIDPSYMEKVWAITEDALIAKGTPDQQISVIIEMGRKFATISLLIGLVMSVIMGTVISLITSAFIQRKGDVQV
jgi:hypothetical protein